MASQLTNPLLYQTREGSLADPFIDKIESVKPINGRAALEEVPVKEFGVIVDGYIEKITNTPTGNEFYVDYTNGVLYFKASIDATVTVRYKGRGVVLIPAERVYYGDYDKNETLDVSIASLQKFVEEKGRIDWLDPVATYADLARIYPNPTDKNQVQVLDTGYIYRFKNGVWDAHLFSPAHPQNMARHTDRFIATQGQTVFNTTKPYFTNQDRIDVYVSGVKQASGIDFNETSPTRITLTTGCEAGEIVETVYLKTTEAQALDLIEQVQAAEAATTAATAATQGANTAKQAALDASETTKFIWQNPVNTFAQIATTYPNPSKGWAVAVRTGSKIYRYDGSQWLERIDLSFDMVNILSDLVDTSDINGGMFGESVTELYVNGGTF